MPQDPDYGAGLMQLDRRTFLLGAAGAGLVAACGGDDGAAGPDLGAGGEGTPQFLVPTAPDGFIGPSPLVAGVEQRVAYALHDGTAVMRENAPATAEIGIFFNGEQVGGGPIGRRSEGPESLPGFDMAAYYPIYFTPAEAGTHVARLLSGAEPTEREFMVLEPGQTPIPQPGDLLPSIHTATTSDLRGIADLCTRGEDCPFHSIDLADALDGAQPVVLSIATPGFCQTEVCGPVIELLIELAEDRTDLHVIHAEVYVDAQGDLDTGTFPGTTTEIVSAFGLPFEPVLFVAKADGTIVRRLDATYDRSELAESLALV